MLQVLDGLDPAGLGATMFGESIDQPCTQFTSELATNCSKSFRLLSLGVGVMHTVTKERVIRGKLSLEVLCSHCLDELFVLQLCETCWRNLIGSGYVRYGNQGSLMKSLHCAELGLLIHTKTNC